MSSSAEELDWSVFTPKPTGLDEVRLLGPDREIVALLQRYQQDLQAERAAGEQSVEQVLTIAATQAALVHRLRVVLKQRAEKLRDAGLADVCKQLTIVCNQMAEALDETGLTIVDPVGKSIKGAEEQVDVVGWRLTDEFTDEVVAETIEPIVLHNEKVIRIGRVYMGGPEKHEEGS